MNSSNPRIPLKGILHPETNSKPEKVKRVIISEIREINKPILKQLNFFFQDEESPHEFSPGADFYERRHSSGTQDDIEKERNPGEPLFPYPPIIYSEKKENDISKWFHIAQKANITNNLPGKGHNLKDILELRKEDKDKHQRLLYAFTTGKRYSEVLQMDQFEFFKKNAKSPKTGKSKNGMKGTKTYKFSNNFNTENTPQVLGDDKSSKMASNNIAIRIDDVSSPFIAHKRGNQTQKSMDILKADCKSTPTKTGMALSKFTDKFYINKDHQKRSKLNSIIKLLKNQKETKRANRVKKFFKVDRKKANDNKFYGKRSSQPNTRQSTASCTTRITRSVQPKLMLNDSSKLNRCFNIHCKEIAKIERMRKAFNKTQSQPTSPASKAGSFERRLSNSMRSDLEEYSKTAKGLRSASKLSKFREIQFKPNKTQLIADFQDEQILKETCAPGIRRLVNFYNNFQDIRCQLRSSRRLLGQKSSSVC
ncbi:unnamed protein product [Moneuplotes crassus]|uniref:Uncharacterized protein n=1 Tax=Euplotes crassus TaxID=5936 RepID=A0AAD1U985_EUPCR|nr:unnamed protein product [Moneuplotes crassus]